MPHTTLRAALALAGAALLMPAAATAAPPRGYAVVTSAQFASAPQTHARGFVTCPPHTVPLGGGAFVGSSSTAVNLNTSFPTAVGWAVDVNNASEQAASYSV